MLYGYDVSQYQPNFDHHRARREGFEFCGLRAVGSENNADTSFHRHLRDAQAAGVIVIGAYLFVNDKFSAAAQADTWLRHVPPGIPLIIDSEPTPWSGQVWKSQEIVNRVRAAGRPVSLVYMGANMNNQLGRPDIRGLGTGLWSPHYPDNNGGTASQIYQRVPGSYWHGYGGFGAVSVLQYSQSASIAGNTPTDANAFLGTREDLLRLIGGEDFELKQDEIDALFDIREELLGSRDIAHVPGWLAPMSGATHTLLDFVRWCDWHLCHANALEAGQATALRGLIQALDAQKDFDSEALAAEVKAVVKSALEKAVVDVKVNVQEG